MTESNIDARDFRRALGKFPTGVTVVTTRDNQGNPIGVTASSFNSVSIDPPLVLWSVDKRAYSAGIFQDASHFAVNVLAKDQVDMSNRFAGRGEDKFANLEFQESPNGSPLFEGCSAQFQCKTWNVYEGGDHFIVVGEVLDYHYSEARPPLVFAEGSYAVSMQHPSSVSNESMRIPGNGFLGDYLLYLLRVAYANYSSQLYPKLLENYRVTPEEWRVLTLLGDVADIKPEQLANMTGQPFGNLNATVQLMAEKGLVSEGETSINLTNQGAEVANAVAEFARSYEASMLDRLSDEQQQELKNGLKLVADTAA